MGIQLPYGDNTVEFIPYGAPVQSVVDNKAPRQLKANIEYLYDMLMGLTSQGFEAWSDTETYWEGEVVKDSNGELYRSLVDNNTAPLSDTASWYYLGVNESDIGATYSVSNVNADGTVSSQSVVYVDTSTSTVNLQLPDSPQDGDSIVIKDAKDNAQNNPVRVYTNSTNGEYIIQSPETEIMLDVNGFMVEFLFSSDDNMWYVINLS